MGLSVWIGNAADGVTAIFAVISVIDAATGEVQRSGAIGIEGGTSPVISVGISVYWCTVFVVSCGGEKDAAGRAGSCSEPTTIITVVCSPNRCPFIGYVLEISGALW